MTEQDLKKKFPLMTPSRKPPVLWRINGCGFAIYGSRDADAETSTYVTTWCFSLLFIPILALSAYRVAPAKSGWYFIGLEPLSKFAKGWNTLLIAAALVTFGAIQFQSYVSSPSYKAKQQMSSAKSLADQGQLGRAAEVYEAQVLADTDQTANAAAAIKALLDNTSSPLSEMAKVYAVAARTSRRGSFIPSSEVADKGLKLATARGDSDPRSAVALLDAIQPLVIDTRPLDDQRLILLRAWVAKEPQNPDAIVPLASILETKGKLDEAKALLLPIKDKLGDGEGARVLGLILGHDGDYDSSYSLLWPYVKTRLDRLHAAEKDSDDAAKHLWDREVQLLSDNKAPQEFYDKYKAAGPDEQKALVRQYINDRIKNDPLYTGTQDSLEKEAKVVPVALELGMVMLQRAQEQTSAEARKAQLESAEKVFLSVAGIAGETDEYRLSLGQVYYWLGKQTEGKKLFDDFLAAKGRDHTSILEIAGRLRQLGAHPDARAMAEEAYTKAKTPEEKYEAATLRALCRTDLDDEIVWVDRTDPSQPAMRAWRAKSAGAKAYRDGQDDEAIRQYRIALDVNSSMPRTSETLNESALGYLDIFRANGDHRSFDRCIDCFQQAVDLDPSNSIILFNAGVTLLSGAMADVIGKDIDLRALHEEGSVSLLRYLYKDHDGREALARRVKDHPGVIRALSYLQKVLVLSPKSNRAWSEVYSIYEFTHDQAALTSLREKMKAANLDNSDQLIDLQDQLKGTKDQTNLAALTVSSKRSENLAAQLRPTGGATAAVALGRQIEQVIQLHAISGTWDLDQALTLAEEAHNFDPSSTTSRMLITVHCCRAENNLRRIDPAFDSFCAKFDRSVDDVHLLAVAASQPSSFQQAVIESPETKAAVELIKAEQIAFPAQCMPFEWALMKQVDPQAAETKAAAIRNSSLELLENSVERMLEPYDTAAALDAYWLMKLEGQPQDGAVGLQKLIAAGVPVPIQP